MIGLKACFALFWHGSIMLPRTSLVETNAGDPERAAAKPGFLTYLGLQRSHSPADADALDRRITGFGPLWGIVALAMTLAVAAQGRALIDTPRGWLTVLAVLIVGIGPLAIFYVPVIRQLKPNLRMIMLTLVAAVVGYGCGQQAVDAAMGGASPAQALFIISAGFVILAVFSRLPAAMLSFATLLIVTIIAGLQSGLALILLAPMQLCVLLTALASARADFSMARSLWKAKLEASRPARLLEELENSGSAWFWETDRRGRILYLSPRIAKVLGSSPDDIVGKPLAGIATVDEGVDNGNSPVGGRSLNFLLSTKTAFTDLSVRAACDEERWWSISGRPVYDRFDQLRGYIGTGTDLTEIKRSEAEVTKLARFDALTGLANRSEIGNLLRQALTGQMGATRPASLFLLDLDRFKNVNDTLGHPAGDALLKQVSQRLVNVIGSNGHVGRLGGDEFKVVLPGKTSRSQIEALAKALIESVSRPYLIERNQVSIGVSVGIAVAPDDGLSDNELTRNADLALYAAKAAGRGVHRFYASEMHAAADRRNILEKDLNDAVERGGLRLVYQPVVSCRSERVTGFEALLRWSHPVHGNVSPGEFIPIAEESSLIERVGEWVLRAACSEAARWSIPARVAVNVSPTQFANPSFPTLVAQVLAQTGLPPSRLELEITEGVFMAETGNAERQFETLKRIGVRLALDDFGTGYSSLGYLQRAPLNKIKIDQSFVRGATQGQNQNAAIIRSIVTLAEALGMETTAEGAETEDEIELIKRLGCSHIQGFYYGPPMEVAELGEKLGLDGSTAQKVGHKKSRSQRISTLRRAQLTVAGKDYPVRIRNISETGTMIEAQLLIPPGTTGSLAIQDGPVVDVRSMWWQDNRCGLAFAESMTLEWLAQAALQRVG
jgi:diguanylate cyclase (GGDEF)-like protein/PAS domain S-box-containing protein